MTVERLKELLKEMPNDAYVKFRDRKNRLLIGDDHYVEAVEYDEKKNIVWLLETLC